MCARVRVRRGGRGRMTTPRRRCPPGHCRHNHKLARSGTREETKRWGEGHHSCVPVPAAEPANWRNPSVSGSATMSAIQWRATPTLQRWEGRGCKKLRAAPEWLQQASSSRGRTGPATQPRPRPTAGPQPAFRVDDTRVRLPAPNLSNQLAAPQLSMSSSRLHAQTIACTNDDICSPNHAIMQWGLIMKITMAGHES